jgi:hypothetical protein
VLTACNVTEALQAQRYSAETCGVKKGKIRNHEKFYLIYVLAPLATCFVGAGIFARVKLVIGLGLDDWTMLAALFGYLASISSGLGIAINGFRQHTYWLTTNQVTSELKVSGSFLIVAHTYS